jgi:hypothetical protein
MASVANINDVLEGHVALEVECVDRLYLNVYMPSMQVGGQVVRFLRGHLGYEIPSPALLAKIGNRFRRHALLRAPRRVEHPVVFSRRRGGFPIYGHAWRAIEATAGTWNGCPAKPARPVVSRSSHTGRREPGGVLP